MKDFRVFSRDNSVASSTFNIMQPRSAPELIMIDTDLSERFTFPVLPEPTQFISVQEGDEENKGSDQKVNGIDKNDSVEADTENFIQEVDNQDNALSITKKFMLGIWILISIVLIIIVACIVSSTGTLLFNLFVILLILIKKILVLSHL